MQPPQGETIWQGLRRHGNESRRLAEALHAIEVGWRNAGEEE
jgi:hypothetical protein